MIKEIIPKQVYKISFGNLNSNCYLLDYDDRKILIDSCDYKSRQKLIDSFRQLKIESKDINAVLLTHLHFDHSGNAPLFKESKIYASKAEIDSFNENPAKAVSADALLRQEYLIKELKTITMHPLSELDIPGIEVIDVPGHTIGSVAFYLEKERILFTGDTLFKEDGTVRGRTYMQTSVPEKMEKSVKKLMKILESGSCRLCAGHEI